MSKSSDASLRRQIDTHPHLALLDPDVRTKLERASRVVPFGAKRPILREGEPARYVYCLLEGAVRVFHRAEDGREVVVKLFRAPALFGEMEVLVDSPWLEYVTTIEPWKVRSIPADAFRALIASQPRFTRSLVRDLSARLCIATRNERALAFVDIDGRVANLLLDYVQLAGEPLDEGIRIGVPLSQKSLANDLGASRKSIVRAFEKLRALGIISKSRARYVVRDVEALRQRGTVATELAYQLIGSD